MLRMEEQIFADTNKINKNLPSVKVIRTEASLPCRRLWAIDFDGI